MAARALVSLIISFLDIKRKGISVWGNNKTLLMARGCVGATALICVYFSVVNLPLAEATILQYTHPVFTALLAILVLRERIQPTTFICILFSLTGLYLMVTPGVDGAQGAKLPLFSVALGWVFFSEIPTIWTWMGGGLIMIGTLVNVYGSLASRVLKPVRAS